MDKQHLKNLMRQLHGALVFENPVRAYIQFEVLEKYINENVINPTRKERADL